MVPRGQEGPDGSLTRINTAVTDSSRMRSLIDSNKSPWLLCQDTLILLWANGFAYQLFFSPAEEIRRCGG